MTPADQIVQQLTLHGISLTPQEDRLHYAGPQQQITPELLQVLKENKQALLRYLCEPVHWPCSYSQQGLWAIHQQTPENSAYTVSVAFQLHGPLNVLLLSDVIQLLVNRHAALRTRFVWQADALLQQVDGYQRAMLEEIDAAGWSQDQIHSTITALHERPFDLEQGPLFRTTLLRHEPEHFSLLLSIHHIVVDGWSMYQLIDELFVFYQALQTGAPVDLPIVQHTYADYVGWQQAMLEQKEDELWDFWRTQLQGELPVLQLPADFSRPPRQALRGIGEPIQISAALTARLKVVARQNQCTLYMLLLAAWQILLHRHSGQEELLVGLPMAGRSRREFEEVIGYFVSPVVMRTDIQGDPSFQTVLTQVKSRLLAALGHQDYPFVRLVERLNPSRDPSRSPVFQSSFVLQKSHRSQDRFLASGGYTSGDLRIEAIPLLLFAGQEDIALELTESKEGLQGAVKASADILTPATLARMAKRFLILLATLADDNPLSLDRPIAELPQLTEAERHQLLVEWNDTAADYPQDQCVHTLFEEQVARTPDAVAVVFEGQQLTYAELNARANQLAHHLQSLGVGPDVLVGLCVERSLEMVVGLLGILKAGGAYVPLDPTYPPERLALMIAAARTPILLTQARLYTHLPPTPAPVICLDSDWPTIAAAGTHNPPGAAQADHLAYVIFTSGSTGQPKGAGVYQRGFTNLIHWYITHFGLAACDRTLITSSFSFDLTQKNFFAPLLVGGQIHLSAAPLYDHVQMLTLIEREQITWLNCAPSAFYPFLEPEPIETPEEHYQRLTALRYVFLGGEPINHRRLTAWLDSPACRATVVNTYGPTECTDVVASYRLSTAAAAVPIGAPIFNCRLYLLDQQRQPVPIGLTGEIYIGGVCVGSGYVQDEQLTAEKFISNPFGPGRLYKTGDLGRYLPDGNIEYLGRIDHQVKIRGFRIELGEIEAALSSHPAVQECVVVAREDAPGDKRLAAYVVLSEGQEARDEGREASTSLGARASRPTGSSTELIAGSNVTADLRTHLQTRLPDYMVPGVFVTLEALPLTPNGKVDRRALPVPDLSLLAASDSYVAPRTAGEAALAAIWQDVLGLPQVSVADNFFALGGHSLLATQVISRIRQRLGVDLPLRAFFETPTVAGLAAQIDRLRQASGATPAAAIPLADRSQPLPLSHAQERLWFLDQLDADHSAYNIPGAVRLTGQLDVAALERSLQEIVRRHETLRTVFVVQERQPVQQIAPPTFTLPLIDLSRLDTAAQKAETRRLLLAELHHAFDLAQGPLFRATLLCLQPAAEYVLLLNMHHTISDGWSLEVLQRELAMLYTAFTQRRPSPLPELALQYADFAVWQRQWLAEGALDKQLAWWQAQLAGAPELLALPTDRPRPPVQSFRGATHTFTLPPDLVEQVRSLSSQCGASLFMTLLAAYQTLLMRWSGQRDIVVGAPVANRHRVEIEPLIGVFVNTLALRSRLEDEAGNALSFVSLLEQVRQTTLEAQRHQDAPFEKVVEVLQPTRNLSHSPLFQVMFNLLQATAAPLALPGVKAEPVDADYPVAKFDLTLTMVEESGGAVQAPVTASFEYNTDLFDRSTIERMAGHFQTLLQGIVANPAQSVAELPLLTEEERHQLLVEWNATAVDYPQNKCIHTLFEDQVAHTPDAVAVVFAEQQLTYAELNVRANQLAHHLQSLDVGPDVLVGLCVDRSLEMVVGLLGILKAGGAYVPLDPTYPAERLAFMLADAAAPVLLTQAHLLDILPATDAQVVCLDRDWPMVAVNAGSNPYSPVEPQHLAYVIYTSGSTGRPKGAMNAHLGVVNRLLWMQDAYHLQHDDRVLQKTPFSFDVSVWEFFWPLLTGAQLVVARPEGHKDPAYLVDIIRQERITTLHFVPSMLGAFLAVGDIGACPSIRRVICSGEALGHDLQERFLALSDAELHNLYGPTEAAVDVSYWACQRADNGKVVPIGRPVANTQLYVLDAGLRPVPIGVAGELHIGGVQVGRGYLNRPELTAEKFIPNPFGPGRLYKTGDLTRWLPDGNIEYLGRIDHQVKIRGFRIELGEIEAALSSYPAVQECVVLAREDAPGDKRLVAYVVLGEGRGARGEGPEANTLLGDRASRPTGAPTELTGSSAVAADLRRHLQTRLPDYMVPSVFVTLDALPLTPNGKVDRKALPAPSAADHSLLAQTSDAGALTPTEATLAAIWQQVLRLPQVGVDDNFFTVGGDSILSIQVVSRARQAGLQITSRQIFQHQTVRQLAAVATPTALPTAAQGEITGTLPLTPIQHWFLEQGWEEAHHFNQAMLLEVAPGVNVLHLQDALTALLGHHDALRLRFVQDAGGWRQENAPVGDGAALAVFDLSALTPEQRRTRLAEEADRAQASLNLQDGPLVRSVYFNCGSQEPGRLLLVIHHLAVDGVSWRTLLEDLQSAYAQRSQGAPIQLPAKTTAFRDWAHWLAADGVERLRAERTYWQEVIGRCDGALPVDEPEGLAANTVGSAEEVVCVLDAEATAALLQQAPAAWRTQVNDLLLAALARAVSGWSGQSRVVLDLEGHGRELLEDDHDDSAGLDLSRTVGWFTSLFPVVLEADAADAGHLIRSIKEQLRSIPHRGVGYGVLRYLDDEEGLAPAAPIGLSFNYLGQFDAAVAGDTAGEKGSLRLGFVAEGSGQPHSPSGLRSHLLDVNAVVVQGELQVAWSFSRAVHHRQTIEALAAEYLAALRQLIDHCCTTAGGCTPSDFTAQGLDQAELDQWFDRYGAGIEEIYELSPMQEGMLFESLYAPESGVYVTQLCFTLDAAVQAPAFHQAWQELVDRHPILRTLFLWQRERGPLQLVQRRVELPWTEERWDVGIDEEAALRAWLEADRRRGFVLDQAPLMRCALLRAAGGRIYFVWTSHHLIGDGWSLPLLVQDLLARYAAACAGRALALPASRPYRDYILWLRRQDRRRSEAFWREQLQAITAPTPLAVDRPAAARGTESARYVTQEHELTPELTLALNRLAQALQVTLNTVVQGAWALLLSRYSGNQAVLFGATVSGRPPALAGVEQMVGLFINTVPIAAQVTGAAPLAEWLQQLQQTQAAAQEYGYLSLPTIQRWSSIPSGAPLFESILVFENYPVDHDQLESGLALVQGVASYEQTNYPLTVAVAPPASDAENGLSFTFSYDARRFDDDAVTRMAGHLQTLLHGMVDNPAQALEEVPLLTEAERHQLLVEWNDTAADYPQDQCIHMLFEEQVTRTPDAVAVVFADQQLTYAELNARANQLAHHLQSLGVGPDVLVGLCVERSLEMVVGLLGILKAGGAYVPLDPAYPAERLAFMLADAATPVLLTQAHLLESLPASDAHALCLDRDWPLVAVNADSNPCSSVQPHHLAYVIYTSGSTGQPKGVLVEHQAIATHIATVCAEYAITAHDRMLQFAALSFDWAQEQIFAALCNGAILWLPGSTLWTAAEYTQQVITHGITVIDVPPAYFQQLLTEWHQQRPAFEEWQVRLAMLGGDRLLAESVRQWQALVGPAVSLFNTYGPTETTITATLFDLTHYQLQAGPVNLPIGRPLAGRLTYILSERGQPVPTGVAGELYLGGIGVARGYLNRPELTAEKFIPNPFGPGRLYRTGDLVRWLPDGNIEYLGRIDHQVKIRGFRIELGEIEAALSSHPAVQECVVVAREDAPGDKRLAAYVVLSEGRGARGEGPEANTLLGDRASRPTGAPTELTGSSAVAADLRRHLQTRLPDYMVPSVFVTLDALPLTPNGKVDRKALPAPSAADHSLLAQTADAGALTPTEATLAAIWQQVLRLPQVGVDDNFFTVGGDSILSIQVVSRARQAGLQITPRQIFQHQTIRQLAAVATPAVRPEAAQGEITGTLPLTPIQHWFLEQGWKEAHYFNQAVLLEVAPGVNVLHLQDAITALLGHHDALRLRFVQDEGGWRQENAPAGDGAALAVFDLSALTPEQRRTRLAEEADRAQASLNLQTGPLVRGVYFNCGSQEPGRLLLVIHHLAVDGVSWRILLEDLQTAYAQRSQSAPIQLPAKTTAFRDWAHWLAQEGVRQVAGERAYWEKVISQCTSTLPVDKMVGRSGSTLASDEEVICALDGDATAALLQVAPGAYHTQVNDLLLTALAQVVSDWSGQRKVVLELEGHGRELLDEGTALDLSRTVGWFTSLFPVVLDAGRQDAGRLDAGRLICSIKEQLRSIPNRGIGYGVLRYLDNEDGLVPVTPNGLTFNYLGQFDSAVEGEAGTLVLGYAREGSGQTHSANGRRTHLVDVNAVVVNGQLQVVWSFSGETYHRQTIEELAAAYVAVLGQIIEHCRTAAGGYTPSDFTAEGLEQAELNRWFESYGRALEDVYELSPMQQGMLFESLYAPDSGVYVTQLCFTMDEKLDVSAFHQAWREVMERHPILRTLFVWQREAGPVQLVLNAVELPWREVQWEAGIDEEAALQAWLEVDRQCGFRLDEAPLMRCTLLCRGGGGYYFVWTSHHLTGDGWSTPLVLEELFVRYQAACGGRKALLPTPRPYRDYILWLREQEQKQAEAFWKAHLARYKEPTALTVGRGMGVRSTESAAYVKQSHKLNAEVSEAVINLAQEQQVTLNTVVQGAWALLLSRYSGSEEVLFGATISGRPASLAGVEQMVGLFINTVPLGISVRGSAQLGSWLQEVQETQAAAQEYGYLSLAEIQRWSGIPQGTPLFESIVVFENYPVNSEQLEAGPALVKGVAGYEQTNYPLTVAVTPHSVEEGGGLTFAFGYDSRRLDRDAIERMAGHLQALLQEMVNNPARTLGEISLLTAAERHQLLVEWNDTAADYPLDKCIHTLFAEQVERTPDAVAVVFEEQQLTYAELNARANQLAHHLQSLGVGPDVLVGLCVERSLEMVVGLLGILKAGGAYVPLDPTYPAERLAFMLADAATPVLLTQAHLLDTLPATDAQVLCLDRDWSMVAVNAGGSPHSLVQPQHLAYVIYTSGSTGRPKGVLIPHQAVCNQLFWLQERYPLTLEDRFLQQAPVGFDASVREIFWTLSAGACLVLARPLALSDPRYLVEVIQQQGITVIKFVPSLLKLFLEELKTGECGSLRRVFSGGEPLSSQLLRTWSKTLPIELINVYGPTETTVQVTAWDCQQIASLNCVSIGRPIANTQLYILDPSFQPVPIGVSGELYIGGRPVGLGYLNRPELTAEKFIPNSFGPGRLYRTGDLVRWLPDGNLEYLGRIDHQVKIRGFRIELGEIEAVLSSHPTVQECVVVAGEDRFGDKRLVAYVVLDAPNSQHEEMAASLRRHLQARLPDYMAPSAFVSLDALPLTPNGKVDRKALPPLDDISTTHTDFVAPRDAIEQQLAEIWMEILALSTVSIDANFFELGGHSLLALRLLAAVQKHFGQRCSLASLFAQPTIAQLAQYLRQAGVEGQWSSLVAIQPHGERPPFFCVHPVGGNVLPYYALARHLGPDQPFYALQAVGLDGKTAPDKTIAAMATRYVAEIQRIQPNGPYWLGGYSLGGKIAYAMAQVLRQAGHEIALVVILDSTAPTAPIDPSTSEWNDTQWLLEWVARIEQAFDTKLNVAEEKLVSLEREDQLAYLNDCFRQETQGELAATSEQLRGMFQVFKANCQAEYSIPSILPVPLALLRTKASAPADRESDDLAADPVYGWSDFAAGPVELLEIPGDHLSMLQPPHVQAVAARLAQCLQNNVKGS